MAVLLSPAFVILLVHVTGFLPLLALVSPFRLRRLVAPGLPALMLILSALISVLPGPSALWLLAVPRSFVTGLLWGLAMTHIPSTLPIAGPPPGRVRAVTVLILLSIPLFSAAVPTSFRSPRPTLLSVSTSTFRPLLLLTLSGSASTFHLLATLFRRIERRTAAAFLALAVPVLRLVSLLTLPSLPGVLLSLFLGSLVSLVGISVAHSCLLDR